jgi:hypothetical protein
MNKFWLKRKEDISGISGTGIVAEGVIFTDGVAVLRWLTAGGSTAVYDSIESVERIHGHNGNTEVVYKNERDSEDKRGG